VSRLVIAAAVALHAAGAQTTGTGASGTISGSVIDATTATPLSRATVTLTSPDGFAVLVDPRGAPLSFALARTVTTSSAGTYRFIDLPIGAYRLRIQRVGYEPATVDVRLSDSGTSALSIGLVVLPVRLRAVEVRAHDSNVSTDGLRGAMGEDARLAAAHARQETFLSTDVRELTSADVAESATLGGTDVFRSLQRLPGVTSLDDWSAELWVRGNRWDHNRVYFDDLPLFDPLGVLGRTSGVSADAIGGAFLHPGVRPVSLGGEGATRIDLRSRPASGGGDWRGSAEVSQFGANGALERARADTAAGFLVTVHHSLGRWLPDAFSTEGLAGRAYGDEQATVRGDVDLGDGKRLVTSGLFTRDERRFQNAIDANGVNQDWSNAVGRVAFDAQVGPFATSHSVGISRFGSNADRWFAASPTALGATPDSLIASPVASRVDYVTLGGRIRSRTPRGGGATTVGYDVITQRSSIDGTYESPAWTDSAQTHVSRRSSLRYGSAWIDNRTAIGTRVTLENGLRLDVGGAHGLDAIRPAGSAQASFAASPSTRVSVGASRTHQYAQGIDLPVVGQGQTLPTSWLTSGGDVPPMSVDNAMAGVEQWMGTGVLLGANAYLRHTTGAIAADPTPGPLIHRPLFVDATESAGGVELSARKLIGRTTGLLAYSYGNATMRARGLSFPAPASRTHALDGVMSMHLGAFNIGGAYTLSSGAPYTRTVAGAALNPSGGANQVAVQQAPNGQRLPAYSSLDVSLDYARTFRGVSLIGFAGAQNVLGRKNATWYEISGYCENGQSQAVVSPQCRDHDLLEAPVKFAPTIGLRLVVR
jgi:hypothetical protein